MPSLPSMPILHSSSSISDEEGDHEVTTTFNGESPFIRPIFGSMGCSLASSGVPSVSVGLIANTAARSVQNVNLLESPSLHPY